WRGAGTAGLLASRIRSSSSCSACESTSFMVETKCCASTPRHNLEADGCTRLPPRLCPERRGALDPSAQDVARMASTYWSVMTGPCAVPLISWGTPLSALLYEFIQEVTFAESFPTIASSERKSRTR